MEIPVFDRQRRSRSKPRVASLASCHRGKWLRNMLSTDPASVEAATGQLDRRNKREMTCSPPTLCV